MCNAFALGGHDEPLTDRRAFSARCDAEADAAEARWLEKIQARGGAERILVRSRLAWF